MKLLDMFLINCTELLEMMPAKNCNLIQWRSVLLWGPGLRI